MKLIQYYSILFNRVLSEAVVARPVNLRARVQQQLRAPFIALHRGAVERRKAAGGPKVHLRACAKQPLHALVMAGVRSAVERRPALIAHGVQINARANQYLGCE